MGVQVYLYRAGKRISGLADPSGGHFDAAGDFDRLIPTADTAFPVLSRVDPDQDLELDPQSMPELTAEIDRLLPQARQGPEQRGLLRLRALAQTCAATPGASLLFLGD